MGLADTIKKTLGVGATHEEPQQQESSEVSRGIVDHHTPGSFPADTPITEEQRELGSQSNTTGLAGKEGISGHEHKDSGVALSDVSGSHHKTVGQSDLSSSSTTGNNSSKLSDVTHSRPQTVDKSTVQPQPQTGHKDDAGHHFHHSDVNMPKDSSSTGPSETVDSHKNKDTTTLGGLLGGNYMGGGPSHTTDKSTTGHGNASGTETGGLIGSDSHNRTSQGGTDSNTDSSHNTVTQGLKDKSSTDNNESYWGNLPSAAGIYNTVTGSGSSEDHTSQHRRVPTAGDDEVAMQAAGHGPDAHAPRGAGVYNTVVGHGSSSDDTNHSAGQTGHSTDEHEQSPSGGLYNTLSGAAAGGYNAAASAAQGLYNTVSRRSASGTEHQYEHDKPLTTTTSNTNTTNENESPFGATSTQNRSVETDNITTGNQGIAAGAYNTLASAAQGVSNTVTGNNNNGGSTGTGNQYEQEGPYGPTSTTSRNTNTTGNQGVAAGAYNAVASTAQSVANTVTGRSGNETEHQSGLNTRNTTGTERAFPLDNKSPTTAAEGTSGTHDHHSKTGQRAAGVGAGAVAGAGAYDFLHRKDTDAPDPRNEFVSNVNPYNAPHHEGWQHSDSPLFSNSELKRLSLRQKETGSDEAAYPSRATDNLSTSGPGQTHGFHGMSSTPTSGTRGGAAYDTPASLTAAGSRSQHDNLSSTGPGQTHGLGSGHPKAHKSEIPIPSRVHENPSSLAGQRAEPPRSSDHHSNVGAGLAGAGLGAGAGYGVSRLARDHHDDDKRGATSGGIPSSTTSQQQQPVEFSVNPSHHKDTHHKDTSSSTGHSMLPFKTDKRDRHADDTSSSGLNQGKDQHHHHKARDAAAFGAGAGTGAGTYEKLSDGTPSGIRQPDQTTATSTNTSTTSPHSMSSTTSPTSTLDEHQKSRAAAGMTGISPTAARVGAGAGAGAGMAGMNQEGQYQQQQQDMLSRSGGDGHAPLHSTADTHTKERGTTVPSANAGRTDPYNHLSSGTPSGVSMNK
ncbi:hypothetical protein PG994_000762 [Apiospora phragmitis]|uniref:Cell surface protein n=1 Tax=Apiospora phragmitis TaxID=2905665 RepID=A0ABR1X787_9PEZI